MKKYKISTDEKDRLALGNANNANSIVVGSNKIYLGSNSSCTINGMKIVCKNGRVYVNGKLIEQEGQRYAYRIIAIEDIKDNAGKVIVKAGEKGGYVESEENLSQEGTCWIFNDAGVIEDAKVSGSAQIRNDATISGGARVCDNAIISDNAQIYNNARISGNAKVYGDAEVYNNATVSDNAKVYGCAEVYNNAHVSGNAKVYGDAEAYNNVTITDYAEVYGDAEVYNNAHISGNAKVCDDAEVHDEAKITDEVKVCKDAEIFGDTTLTGKQCIKESIIPEDSNSNNIVINGITISIGSNASKSKNNKDKKFLKDPYNKGEIKGYKAKNQSQFVKDFEGEL